MERSADHTESEHGPHAEHDHEHPHDDEGEHAHPPEAHDHGGDPHRAPEHHEAHEDRHHDGDHDHDHDHEHAPGGILGLLGSIFHVHHHEVEFDQPLEASDEATRV